MQKRSVSMVIWLAVLLTAGTVYIFLQEGAFSTIENRIRDLFFVDHHTPPLADHVVIVDIDEKSLQALGQWPWERSVVATLIQAISETNVTAIGLDIVFAEADKTSPAYIDKKLGLGLKHPLNYDTKLAKVFESVPTVTGYVFDMKGEHTRKDRLQNPVVVVERNKQGEYLLQAKGAIANIPILQKSARSSGFINVIPDRDGIIRNIPLLLSYEERVYPSLALEMVRVAMQEQAVVANYEEEGISSVQIGEKKIPTNRNAQMAIHFRGPAHTFPYISAIDILRHQVDRTLLEGKLILIGSSSSGLMDLRATPVTNVIAGVEIHANIIDNILQGDFLYSPDWITGYNFLFFIVLFSLFFVIFLSLDAMRISIIALVGAFGLYYGLRWILFSQGVLVDTLSPFLALALALLAAIFINYFYESRQRKQIRSMFDKKVSPSVVEELMHHQNVLQNREEEITILFSDIRNFTTLAEQIDSPHRLITLLNTYITPMTEIILDQKGTVDKFMGDGIMAYWNAPKPIASHADMAVRTALLQSEALSALNQEIKKEYGIELEIGIGINTGKAIVGEIGSKGRSDYTVIGDSINLASRIEHLNKQYDTRILISEYTKDALQGDYDIHELDRVKVKGRSKEVRIFEVREKI